MYLADHTKNSRLASAHTALRAPLLSLARPSRTLSSRAMVSAASLHGHTNDCLRIRTTAAVHAKEAAASFRYPKLIMLNYIL